MFFVWQAGCASQTDDDGHVASERSLLDNVSVFGNRRANDQAGLIVGRRLPMPGTMNTRGHVARCQVRYGPCERTAPLAVLRPSTLGAGIWLLRWKRLARLGVWENSLGNLFRAYRASDDRRLRRCRHHFSMHTDVELPTAFMHRTTSLPKLRIIRRG